MIRIAGSVSKGWLAKRLSVAFDRDYYFDPCKRHAVDQLCNAYVEGELGEFGMFYTESNLGRTRVVCTGAGTGRGHSAKHDCGHAAGS